MQLRDLQLTAGPDSEYNKILEEWAENEVELVDNVHMTSGDDYYDSIDDYKQGIKSNKSGKDFVLEKPANVIHFQSNGKVSINLIGLFDSAPALVSAGASDVLIPTTKETFISQQKTTDDLINAQIIQTKPYILARPPVLADVIGTKAGADVLPADSGIVQFVVGNPIVPKISTAAASTVLQPATKVQPALAAVTVPETATGTTGKYVYIGIGLIILTFFFLKK